MWCNRFAQVLCFVVFMQSSFTIHEMDSASEPPSPMAAAASVKRKIRSCSNCTGRMPSIDFDTHTLCIGCRNQVCDLNVHCDQCRDWPDTKHVAFVKYNRTLKAKRDYKARRKARLSAARSSDWSVYDTDTDVPSIDEPSVPVKDANLYCVGSQESVVSQECVVSESGGLSEAGPSEVLYVTSGDSLEQLASCLLSKMNELQSDRGRLPPVQSHSIVGSGSRPIVAATDYLGVSAPPQGVYLPNPVNPVFRLPTAPVSDETPHHRLFASGHKEQDLEKSVSATRLAISSLCDRGFQPLNHFWIRFRPFPRTWKMLGGPLLSFVGRFAPLHHSLGFRHSSSDSPLLRLSSQALRIQKAIMHPLVHLGDGPTNRLQVRWAVHLARGVILLPTRGVGSPTIRLPMRANRLQIADNGTISRTTGRIFVLLLWLSCWTTS